jgi:hypothetical protein
VNQKIVVVLGCSLYALRRMSPRGASQSPYFCEVYADEGKVILSHLEMINGLEAIVESMGLILDLKPIVPCVKNIEF